MDNFLYEEKQKGTGYTFDDLNNATGNGHGNSQNAFDPNGPGSN